MAVVPLIGTADSSTISTMPLHDATKDIFTDYAHPADMTDTGEIIDGEPHLRRAVAAGITPMAVADLVADAVTEDRFWVLPHPAFVALAAPR